MTQRSRRTAVVAVALLAAACRPEGPVARPGPSAPAPSPAGAREIPSPAAAGSGEASLVAAPDGRVLLSWLEPAEGGRHALRFAERRPGEPWSAPRTIAAGADWFVNWADFPRLTVLDDGTLVAHWMQRSPGGGTYAYDVRLVRSGDAGATWSEPVAPYRDRTPAEHGFVSFAPTGGPGVGVLFLDGRANSDGRGATALRFASWDRAGAPAPDAVVDDRVCDCCQTALVRTPRGLVAAYRDRSPAEERDVAVRLLADGRWTAAAWPGGERWTIAACPVNGPALASRGDRVALAWYTMAGDRAVVKAALSADGGASWSPPVVVDDASPFGRVDVVATPRGAVVAWLAASATGAEVRLRAVRADGVAGPPAVVARTSGARAAGFPQLERAGSELVVAWRDGGESARVRTAVIDVLE